MIPERGPGASDPRRALFVYGTLRAGKSAHDLLGPAVLVGSGRLPGRLEPRRGYPALVLESADPPRVWVEGEVWSLPDDETLDRLDRYEGCHQLDPEPHFFERVRATVSLATGELVESWVYVAGPAG